MLFKLPLICCIKTLDEEKNGYVAIDQLLHKVLLRPEKHYFSYNVFWGKNGALLGLSMAWAGG